MCGIAGIWGSKYETSSAPTDAIQKMAEAVHHRGPDDTGYWWSSDRTLALAHKRLSIQDLSSLGHQPMESASGRFIIVFNGEIYNFKRLSKELSQQGCSFRGHSDTEVMLAAFDTWGVDGALQRLDGMFAFAAYDRRSDELWLARDRLGEKPLYFSLADGHLTFCSEMKGILRGIDKRMRLDGEALGSYFRFGYLPATRTPFIDIQKLSPASYLRICRNDIVLSNNTQRLASSAISYWQRNSATNLHPSAHASEQEVLGELERLLTESVEDQAVADVNVGVFLSGGIDSTLVAALLQKNSTRKINTYTIAFDSAEYNEAPFARDIAKHIGSNHTEIPVSIDECLNTIQHLPTLLDEPFADSSLIPSFLVCRAAKEHVTVCLSGDGGDELFGGYNRYIQGARLSHLMSRLPEELKLPLGQALSYIPEQIINNLYLPFSQISNKLGRKSEKDIGAKIHKIARCLQTRNDKELYTTLLSFWHTSPVLNTNWYPHISRSLSQNFDTTKAFATNAMECDLDFYLVCDNLFKVDRAAMATSLEVRLPLLDRRIVEFAESMPLDLKIRKNCSKYALRQILYRHVPETLMSRPKMGFSVPLAEWLRKGLKQWGDEQLMNKNILIECGLNPEPIQNAWRKHQKGYQDHSNALWTTLIYLQWHQQNNQYIA